MQVQLADRLRTAREYGVDCIQAVQAQLGLAVPTRRRTLGIDFVVMDQFVTRRMRDPGARLIRALRTHAVAAGRVRAIATRALDVRTIATPDVATPNVSTPDVSTIVRSMLPPGRVGRLPLTLRSRRGLAVAPGIVARGGTARRSGTVFRHAASLRRDRHLVERGRP
ncbi:hypothetical protein GCM10027432_09030 [Lysobacter fragariae]